LRKIITTLTDTMMSIMLMERSTLMSTLEDPTGVTNRWYRQKPRPPRHQTPPGLLAIQRKSPTHVLIISLVMMTFSLLISSASLSWM